LAPRFRTDTMQNTQFIDINLLPKRVRPAVGGAAWARLMAPGLLLLLVATVLVLFSVTLKMQNDRLLTEQRAEMERRREDVRDFDTVINQVTLLREQITTLATQTEQLRGDAERVNSENPPLAPFLSAVTSSLLPRMRVTGITLSEVEGVYLIQGEAGSDALVVEYIQTLKVQPEIRNVTPRLIERLGGNAPPNTVRWTLEVTRAT
jgi:hypothetical protein